MKGLTLMSSSNLEDRYLMNELEEAIQLFNSVDNDESGNEQWLLNFIKDREERLIREARAKQTKVIQKLINEALAGEDIKLDLKIDTVHLTKDEKEVLDDNLLELL